MLTYPSFEDAKAALPEGHCVSGVYLNEEMTESAYFHVPVDATDDTMRELAHLAKGQPLTDYQRYVLARAKEMREREQVDA